MLHKRKKKRDPVEAGYNGLGPGEPRMISAAPRKRRKIKGTVNLVGLCISCGVNRRDPPSQKCVGCQAYED